MNIPLLIAPEGELSTCEQNYYLYKRGYWDANGTKAVEVLDYNYDQDAASLQFVVPNVWVDLEVVYEGQM